MKKVTSSEFNKKIYIGYISIGHGEDLFWASGCNYAGGVSLKFSLTNNSLKTIKYVYSYITPYNRVNDPVACLITGESQKACQYIGPLANGQYTGECIYDNVWYNATITRVRVDKIVVEYTDGTHEMFSEKDIGFEQYGGCYIATAIYGSYDCTQVMVLRNYRDKELCKTLFGRVFISCYYKISPTFVKHFGENKLFKKFGRKILNNVVNRLREKGY